MNKLQIDEVYRIGPYQIFQNTIYLEKKLHFEEALKITPFFIDNDKSFCPYEDPDLYLVTVFQEGKEKLTEATQYFQKRQKNKAKKPLLFSLALWIDSLYWMNYQRFQGFLTIYETMEQLEWKPINVEERIQFILSQSTLFHSSIQLEELYEELIKINAKRKSKND